VEAIETATAAKTGSDDATVSFPEAFDPTSMLLVSSSVVPTMSLLLLLLLLLLLPRLLLFMGKASLDEDDDARRFMEDGLAIVVALLLSIMDRIESDDNDVISCQHPTTPTQLGTQEKEARYRVTVLGTFREGHR
jgi:hypothetical protein